MDLSLSTALQRGFAPLIATHPIRTELHVEAGATRDDVVYVVVYRSGNSSRNEPHKCHNLVPGDRALRYAGRFDATSEPGSPPSGVRDDMFNRRAFDSAPR